MAHAQRQMAKRLLAELETCGVLEGEEDVSVADVLDALSCAGLELREGAAAATAYTELIRERGVTD